MGIAAYGIIFEIVLLFFSRNPVYSAGLWIGIILALAGAVHMSSFYFQRGFKIGDWTCRRRLP